MTENTITLPVRNRAAVLTAVRMEPGGAGEAPPARRLNVTWSTGAVVRRFDMGVGDYDEALDLRGADLGRLNGGAPLLRDHASWSIQGVIGVVERAWIDGESGMATVRLSDREELAPLWADIQAGIIRNVSVGYSVRRYEVEKRQGGVPLYTATEWEPFEISLVPIGADAAAGVQAEQRSFTCRVETRRSNEESAIMTEQTVPAETGAPPAPSADQVRAQAIQAERARVAKIVELAELAKLNGDFIRQHTEAGTPIEQVSEFALRARAQAPDWRIEQTSRPSGDDPSVIRSAMATALAARGNSAVKVPGDSQARQYTGLRFGEMARAWLQAKGERVPFAAAEVIERAFHTTSDFPLILADAGNKMLEPGYQAAQPSYREFMAPRQFNDFKPSKFLRVGDFPALLEVQESGEVKTGTIGEERETITLREFGRRVAITRQALINDDLGAFSEFATLAGRRLPDFENARAYAVLAENSWDGPTLRDGVAVFATAAGRLNKAAEAGAINVTTLGTARAAMAKQSTIDGIKLNITPAILLVGPDKLTEAETMVATLVPRAASDVNPFSNRLRVVTDANITGNLWYLFAEPSLAPVFAYGSLAGAAGPRFMIEEQWSVSGVEVKLMHDFGVGAIDYRGGYHNTGA